MAASAILKIRKIAISRPRLERFRQNLAQCCSSNRLTVLTVGKLKFCKSELWIDMHRSFNIDEHLTEQHWQPVFLFSKPSVSIHVCCSYIELSRSKLHKTGDLEVGNWHVNCQHSSIGFILSLRNLTICMFWLFLLQSFGTNTLHCSIFWNYWNLSYQTEYTSIFRHCVIDICYPTTDLLFCETSY